MSDEHGLELRTRYWDDRDSRGAFKAFVRGVFGLDFSEWETAGYWDPAFTPFSFFEGERVVASICIYLLDAVVEDQATRFAQISTVATAPAWRRQGLNRQLTEIGLEWARGKHEGVFLFADDEAVPYYERCGFAPLREYVEVVDPVPVRHRPGMIKLDPGDPVDRARIHAFAERRCPVSTRFSVGNARLLMFHALYPLRDHVYEVPDLDCLVFFHRQDTCLRLYDVVGVQVPPWTELYPYLADPADREIEIHFAADQLDMTKPRLRPLLENRPFTRDGLPVECPVFPYTCRA